MPVCGNCGKSVDKNDITCPHCGALLAAYASPAGSGETPQIDLIIHSEPTTIPSVRLDTPEPRESPVAIDAEIMATLISQMPQPLFNTNISVEEIAQAADSDAVESVVVLGDSDVVIHTPQSPETPTYARPLADAKRVAVISTEVQTIDNRSRVTSAAPASSHEVRELWLEQPMTVDSSAVQVRKKTQPHRRRRSEDPVGRTTAPSPSTGSTEAYVKRLHEQAGYDADRAILPEQHQDASSDSARRDNRPRGIPMLPVVIFLWIMLIMSIASGHPNFLLIVITLGVTWSRPGVRRFINGVRS